MTAHRVRWVYVGAAIITILLGLWVHGGGAGLGADGRDIAGDALWAAMIAWGVGALSPRSRLSARGATAFGICCAVEVSQLVHTPTLEAWRASTLGALVLGSGFDPRDFVAYAIGVAVAMGVERVGRLGVGLTRR